MAQVASLFEAGKLCATGDKQVEALDGGSRDLPEVEGWLDFRVSTDRHVPQFGIAVGWCTQLD